MTYYSKDSPTPESNYARKKRLIAAGKREPFQFVDRPSPYAKHSSRNEGRLAGTILKIDRRKQSAVVLSGEKNYRMDLRRLSPEDVARIGEGTMIEFVPRESKFDAELLYATRVVIPE